MGKDIGQLYAFNRGLVSNLALARLDVERLALSAETFTNWMPRVYGAMSLRPGTQYVGTVDSASYFVPFIFGTTDTALIQFEAGSVRFWVDEAPIARTSVSASITNGAFTSDATGWTDDDESGASSAWVTGGYLGLTGTLFNEARRTQQVTVTETGTEHALKIIIDRGPVTLRVGSTSGDDDYLSADLGEGEHSLAFTPTGNFYIQFATRSKSVKRVDSVAIDSGTVELTSPYGASDLFKIRYEESADVVYLACDGYQQYKVERRGTRSWSLVKYLPENGPFRVQNTDPITIAASDTEGDITLTASQAIFKSTNVGSLYRIESVGQLVSADITGEDQFTSHIRVTGVDNDRRFTIDRAGTWSGTVTLQRSIGEPGAWVDVTSYTTNGSTTYDDTLDNQVIYYRIGIKSGEYTSGTAEVSLTFAGGSITGVVRITSFSSDTSVGAAVLEDLGGTSASSIWYEGAWSDRRGFPTSVALVEGRLAWAGRDQLWMSVSDGYEDFDDEVEGDSGPISRSIGRGPVDNIHWMLGLQRLLLGTDGAEKSVRSSTFDEPLTPTNFSIKSASTQGSAPVAAVTVDNRGIFVQRSTYKVYELAYSSEYLDYAASDLTGIIPEIGSPGIEFLAVQRQPDTRIHCVRSDGTVAILVFDRLEGARAWVEYETDGEVEQVIVLPGTAEDTVYYLVNRSTGRFLEKWALESECQGGTTNKNLDSHVVYSGSPTALITGLTHLEGKTVYAWADGDSVNDPTGDPQSFTVSSGRVTLSAAASDVVVGLRYTADWKSTKLQFATPVPLLQKKRIDHVGYVLGPTHRKGLKTGPSFDYLDDLPSMEAGVEVTSDWTAYDNPTFPVNGSWDTDSRLCMRAQSPRHATVLGAVVNINAHEKA